LANDRLFMECIECGERLTIAHYYPEGVCGWGPDDAIVKFLSRHVKCCPFSGQFTLRGHPLVRVLAESGEDTTKTVIGDTLRHAASKRHQQEN